MRYTAAHMTDHPATPLAAFAIGALHRAIVALPDRLTEPGNLLEERIVFYEVPRGADYGTHLEQLLASVWCVDTAGWVERGYIYNLNSVAELLEKAHGVEGSGDLRLFETGAGGDPGEGIGPERLRYARAVDVDLFVSPRVASRMRHLLEVIEDLYAAAARPTGEKPG